MKPALTTKKREAEMPEFYRAVIDRCPMPAVFVDGVTLVVYHANPVFLRLAQKIPQTLIGKAFSEALPDSGDCLSRMDRVHASGHAEIFTGQENFPSHPLYFSYVIWPVFEDGGRELGLILLITETTPFHNQTLAMNEALVLSSVRQHELTESAEALNTQLQAQALQLQASEQRYRLLIEAIPQVVWTASPDGILEFVNTKRFEYLGMDAPDVTETGWQALVHPDDRVHTAEVWTSGIRDGVEFEFEHRLRNRNTGGYRWHLSRAIPIGTEPHSPRAPATASVDKWFGTSTDVEDRKRAELAVFNKQKLESLGLLAGGIAHDFNNLLCGILGGASLVADSLAPAHSLQPIVGDMIHASERAAHLTRQMLAYAGKGRFLVEQIDISDLAYSTFDLIRGSIPNHVIPTFDLPPFLPCISADSGQMQQVVMNLILNAAESIAAPTAGSLHVKTEALDLTAASIAGVSLVTGTLTPGLFVILEVKDNGSGMSESTLARIFDPFYTTKFTGRGLGLSAVEGILRTQKGALEVRTALGTGSLFRVYLPAAAMAKPKAIASAKPEKATGTGRILIIDDEEMVRRVMQLSLQGSGFPVLTADSGEQALRILKNEQPGSISLILLDLSMPGMSGRQVMQRIRELRIAIPILICSGYSEEEAFREFSGLDIAGVLQKPFTSNQLSNRVNGILNP